MTKAEARTKLERLCCSSATPALESADLDDLADQAANRSSGEVPDAASADYSNDLYVYRAAAAGWRLKMGRAVEYIDFDDSGQKISRSQYMRHCEKMIAYYARLGRGATGRGSARVGQMDEPDTTLLSNG